MTKLAAWIAGLGCLLTAGLFGLLDRRPDPMSTPFPRPLSTQPVVALPFLPLPRAMPRPVSGTTPATRTTRIAAATSNRPADQANAMLVEAPRTAAQMIARLPMAFEANKGQAAADIQFRARGRGYELALRPSGAQLRLQRVPTAEQAADAVRDGKVADRVDVTMRFEKANHSPIVVGEDELPGRVNYFRSNDPSAWLADVATFAKVRYAEVYPGVDVLFYGNQQQLEYDFVVAPGVDPEQIEFSFDGVDRLRVDSGGDLVLEASGAEIVQRAPRLYQEIDGLAREVAGGYRLTSDGHVGFSIGEYDRAHPLVIDPIILYLSYLGGSLYDAVFGLASDTAGNLVLTGETRSSDFATVNALDGTLDGSSDVFVTKLNPTGSTVLFSTYVGGSSFDRAIGISTDGSNNIVVSGRTDSGSSFPTVNPQFTPTFATSGFVFKLNSTGSALTFSTRIGGNQFDNCLENATDSAGNVYVACYVFSSDIPSTAGVVQPATGGSADGFVVKLAATGALSYATYLGGGDIDSAYGIAVDSGGNAYVTGFTASGFLSPATPGFDKTFGGGLTSRTTSGMQFTGDGYVVKLNPTATAFVYQTYLGGGSEDGASGITVDGTGNAYVTGVTRSTDFPTSSPRQAASGGGIDAFLVKLNPAGTGAVFSTYHGGTGDDSGARVRLDGAGNVYLVGNTQSATFPTASPTQATYGGVAQTGGPSEFQLRGDGFASVFNPTASSLLFSTYLGGAQNDGLTSLVVLDVQQFWVAGVTGSDLTTTGAPVDTTRVGDREGLLLKYGDPPPCSFVLTPASATVAVGGATGNTVGVAATPTSCAWTATSNAAFITITAGAAGTGNGSVTYNVAANPNSTARSGTMTIAGQTFTVNQAGVPCTFSINPTGNAVAKEAGGGSVSVTAAASDCAWTAVSNAAFITVTAGAAGTGNGPVSYTYTANTGSGPRTGTITIAGQTFTLTQAGAVLTYQLAEGATGSFFDLFILIANPNATAAPVTLTFLKPGGSPVVQTRTLAATSRTTILVDSIAGLEDTAVSTVVDSTNGLPLVVERTMYWNAAYYGGHTEKASGAPATKWYFAEGSQGFFDTYVLLANPNASTTVTATVSFLLESGSPVVKTYSLPPSSRTNVYTGAIPELVGKSFAIVVDATAAIAAERAMYFGARLFEGGHDSVGVTAPAMSWFLAEGATGAYFDTYVLIGNPNASAANVTIRYLTGSGTVVTRTKVIPGNTRLTINVESEDPQLADAAVSTTITSDLPVLAERSMYWPGPFTTWFEAHNSAGLTETATKWGLAEGEVGGARSFETYILLANPSTTTAAAVRITYLKTDGTTVVKTYTVNPTTRFNVPVKDVVPELANQKFGAVIEVTNGVPIAVERAMYWNSGSQVWSGGTNATATRLP